ncbi:MAG: hypothetical protein KA250_13210 [Verrucomicrobiales bacterium]|mgnify:CR=1 FL=1|nr:hypothetical protein [Verrucomicrobiales bacterium]
MKVVDRTMVEGLSVKNGSKLSGLGPHNANLDLNRQMAQSNDPQGIYIFGADGTPYGFCNDHGPEDIDKLMDMALERFRKAPPQTVAVSKIEKETPFSLVPPATAQVLQVYARIPNPPSTSTFLNEGVGRDFCWIYEEERREVATLAARGEPFEMPAAISRRLAMFHLVDNVRGTPNMWSPDEVKTLRLTATPDGPGLLQLSGRFSLRSKNGKRTYQGELEGRLAFDQQTFAWNRVRLLAEGMASGAGTYTPNQPPKPYRLLVGILETTLPESRVVPPEGVMVSNSDKTYHAP